MKQKFCGEGAHLTVGGVGSRYNNERRDRETKLKLYSSRGVQDYWILDWRLKQVEIYRRQTGLLQLVSALFPGDRLTSPLLPGFDCAVEHLFLELCRFRTC